MVCINVDVGTVVFAQPKVHSLVLYQPLNNHPPFLKYVNIWNMNKLLIYYDNMGPNSELTFKQLCREIAVLFMLLGARKKQALLTIDIANVIVQTDKAILLLNKTLKYITKHPLEPFVYHSFSVNENPCIVNCLEVYIGERNKRMVGNHGRLMITYRKPGADPGLILGGCKNLQKKPEHRNDVICRKKL